VTQPARPRLPSVDLAARLAHDEPMTLARAARIHRAPFVAVLAAFAVLYPDEPRRAVP
jgi:hypothetical protein